METGFCGLAGSTRCSAGAPRGARLVGHGLGLCVLGAWLFGVVLTTSYMALSAIWLLLGRCSPGTSFFRLSTRRATFHEKIVHIINSFEFGGTEMMLGNLLARADRAVRPGRDRSDRRPDARRPGTARRASPCTCSG